VKVGDLVKYKRYPHESLQHLLGLVVDFAPGDYYGTRAMFVIWNRDRNRGPANTVMFEYVDELEVINEDR